MVYSFGGMNISCNLEEKTLLMPLALEVQGMLVAMVLGVAGKHSLSKMNMRQWYLVPWVVP